MHAILVCNILAMNKIYVLFLISCIIFSCQNPPSGTSEIIEVKSRETVSNTQEEANIAEIRPKLEQMSSAAKTSLDSREILNPTYKGTKVESLHLWSDGAQWPVMLEVNFLDNINYPKAVYYFSDRKLIAVEETNAKYAFKRDKLQVWADKNWQPLKDKTTDQWLDQENYLLNNAKKYLNAFEINYEE